VVVKKNGSTVVTLSLTSGKYHNTALPVDLSLTQFDWLTVETTAAGNDQAVLVDHFSPLDGVFDMNCRGGNSPAVCSNRLEDSTVPQKRVWTQNPFSVA
jgi:hypothetical protein